MNIWKYIYQNTLTPIQLLGFKTLLIVGLCGYIYYTTKYLLNNMEWNKTMHTIRIIAVIALISTIFSWFNTLISMF